MAKHGLTRVQFRGDQVMVVAGSIPEVIAVQGLTKELVEATPVHTPMTPLKPIAKKPNKPPKFIAPQKPQAEVKENESGS